jgi:hypothetical protein
VGDAVTWGSKIYTIGELRCIRSLRGLPGDSLSGTHTYPTMFALQDVYVACRGGGDLVTCMVFVLWVCRRETWTVFKTILNTRG